VIGAGHAGCEAAAAAATMGSSVLLITTEHEHNCPDAHAIRQWGAWQRGKLLERLTRLAVSQELSYCNRSTDSIQDVELIERPRNVETSKKSK